MIYEASEAESIGSVAAVLLGGPLNRSFALIPRIGSGGGAGEERYFKRRFGSFWGIRCDLRYSFDHLR